MTMKKLFAFAFLALGITEANLAFGQQSSRPSDTRRDDMRRPPEQQRLNDRPQRVGMPSQQEYEQGLINAYKLGSRDGMDNARQLNRNAPPASDDRQFNRNAPPASDGRQGRFSQNRQMVDQQEYNRLRRELEDTKRENARLEKRANRYQAFTGGFYVGANTTRFLGENTGNGDLSGRLGYQAGVFTRFGGRVYGQIGAEYFATSSNYFTPGDGQQLQDITGRINTQWLQIPALVGVKLTQSKRGISGVRLAVGAEYANRLGGSNTINLDNNEIKSGTFLALGNLGFDVGPLMIDLMYHHGLNDAINGFANSRRRSLGVNVGFKF